MSDQRPTRPSDTAWHKAVEAARDLQPHLSWHAVSAMLLHAAPHLGLSEANVWRLDEIPSSSKRNVRPPDPPDLDHVRRKMA